jgi:hypothetical protein
MRRNRLVRMAGRRLTILNLDALSTAAMFNPDYLHVNAKDRRMTTLVARPVRAERALWTAQAAPTT